MSALAKLIGKEWHAWQSIQEGKEAHGLAKRPGNWAQDSDFTKKLHDYFKRLESLVGAPRAMRLVTSLANGVLVTTELKDSDVKLIELLTCQSTRSLYQNFLHKHGWTASFDNKRQKVSKKLLDTTNKEEQEGSSPISWHLQVTAIAVPANNEFFDWGALQNKLIAKADGILQNHILTVHKKDSDQSMIHEYDGAPITWQLVV
jgi:hypothetical protein